MVWGELWKPPLRAMRRYEPATLSWPPIKGNDNWTYLSKVGAIDYADPSDRPTREAVIACDSCEDNHSPNGYRQSLFKFTPREW